MNGFKKDLRNGVNPERPRAVAAGVIFGGVDCYVLDGGRTILSNRGMLRGLRGADCGPEKGDLGRYLARLPEKYSALSADPILEFETPEGHLAHGRSAHDFVRMLSAYAEMLEEGNVHKARLPMARNAVRLLRLLADRGIDEIIYEACEYKPTTPGTSTDHLALDRVLLVMEKIAAATASNTTQVTALAAQVATLSSALSARIDALESRVPNDEPTIGPAEAKRSLLRPIYEAAKLKARALGKGDNKKVISSIRFKGETEVRLAVDFPRGEGMKMSKLPRSRFGDACQAVLKLQGDAKIDARLSTDQEQLPLPLNNVIPLRTGTNPPHRPN